MKKFFVVLLSVLIGALLAAQGLAAATGQVFTNTDLEKYKADVDGSIIPQKAQSVPQLPQRERHISKGSNEKSKQYWCARGSSRRANVDKARARVEDAEQKRPDQDPGSFIKNNRTSAEKKVRSAKKELYRAEQSLADLELQARRQKIPPGWLCQ
jgi:hypothetical protein